MRQLPELMPPPVHLQLDRRRIGDEKTHLVTQVRTYELITPLFGGGVEPGVADPVTVIRGSAIRGQLRFWWRACRGGRSNGDLAAMKKAEDELWGAASTQGKPMPSQVEIVVSTEQSGEDKPPFEVIAGMDRRTGKPKPRPRANEFVAPAYAAFPLQPSEKEMQNGGIGKPVRTRVHFTLKITCSVTEREEVEAALWAWETFGGIGARTRRGFGALNLVSVDGRPVTLPGAGEVEAKIREGLQKHVVRRNWPAGVPHLCLNPRMRVTGRRSDPRAAWEYLIRCLRDFRQNRPGASTQQPGRSRWPEPDEIRKLTRRWCDRHAEPLSTVGKFPRAAFGLPIEFRFKDESAGDPFRTTLRGRNDYERLASPLILRPSACADGAVGLAVVLEGTGVMQLPGGLILKGAPGDPTVQATLTANEAKAILPLNGIPDVLEAFLERLQ